MAIPAWLTVSPTSGTGNSSVNVTAAAHTGRIERSGTITVKSSKGSPQKTANVAVSQEAKAEFLSVNTIPMQEASGNVSIVISGKSNAAKIQFLASPNADALSRSMTPTRYSVNGTSYNSGSEITSDPGASAEYTWSAAVDIPANSSLSQASYTFGVKTPNTDTISVTITQKGIAPTLTLSNTSVTIPQAGGSASVNVTSNSTWTVS